MSRTMIVGRLRIQSWFLRGLASPPSCRRLEVHDLHCQTCANRAAGGSEDPRRGPAVIRSLWIAPSMGGLVARPGAGSGERRCAGNGWPINGQRGGELRFVRGASPHDVCAGETIRIGDELPLSMEVADRAVVDRGILAIAVPRHCSLFRAERGRSMTEPGKRVQCRTAQGDDTVERQEHAQQKLIRAPAGQKPTTLEVTGSSYWIDVTPHKPDQRLGIDEHEFERTTAGLSSRFRHAAGLCPFP